MTAMSKADFAFVQHMLHQLDDNGTMAVILPHGALFRGGAEGHIREYIIKQRNWLDAVIGLPANIFYGTSIPTCILVFKKCREWPEDILFVDASTCFERAKNQNILLPDHIDRIITAFRTRAPQPRFAVRVPLGLVAENDYNLNIPRYVDTFAAEAAVDLAAVAAELQANAEGLEALDAQLAAFCAELGLKVPL
jgi:type I restriction enzyme M protein